MSGVTFVRAGQVIAGDLVHIFNRSYMAVSEPTFDMRLNDGFDGMCDSHEATYTLRVMTHEGDITQIRLDGHGDVLVTRRSVTLAGA